jgi:hypothetical protein
VVETLLDLVPHLGKVFSLDACKAVCPWFAKDEAHTWISPLLLALLLRVLCAPILLSVLIATSLMLPMIISVLSGTTDSTEIGSFGQAI